MSKAKKRLKYVRIGQQLSPKDILTISMPSEYLQYILLGYIVGDSFNSYSKYELFHDKDTVKFKIYGGYNLLHKFQAKIHKVTGLPTSKVLIGNIPIYILGKHEKVGESSGVHYIEYTNGPAIDLLWWILYSNIVSTINVLTEIDNMQLLIDFNNILSSDDVKRRYNKSTHPRHNTLPKPVFNC